MKVNDVLICPSEEIPGRDSRLPARSLSKEFVIASPRRLVLGGRLRLREREREDRGERRSQLQWRIILKDLSYELVDMELARKENEHKSLKRRNSVETLNRICGSSLSVECTSLWACTAAPARVRFLPASLGSQSQSRV